MYSIFIRVENMSSAFLQSDLRANLEIDEMMVLIEISAKNVAKLGQDEQLHNTIERGKLFFFCTCQNRARFAFCN